MLSSSHSPLSFEHRTSSKDIPTAPSSPLTSRTPPALSPASTSTHKKLARALTKLDLNAGKSINALRRSNTTLRYSSSHQLGKTRSSKTIKSQFVPWLDPPATMGEGNPIIDEDSAFQCESPVQEFCSGWCSHSDRPQSPTSPRSLGSPEIVSTPLFGFDCSQIFALKDFVGFL